MINANKIKKGALKEAYDYFDKNIRSLPKDADGIIDEIAGGFADNDVDAFQHAYVSGVFTQEYSANHANFLGIIQELLSFGDSITSNPAAAKNMDY